MLMVHTSRPVDFGGQEHTNSSLLMSRSRRRVDVFPDLAYIRHYDQFEFLFMQLPQIKRKLQVNLTKTQRSHLHHDERPVHKLRHATLFVPEMNCQTVMKLNSLRQCSNLPRFGALGNQRG